MKKMFAAALLVSFATACHSKKPAAAPPQDKAPLERKDDATGGATYGGAKDATPGKDTPNPSDPR